MLFCRIFGVSERQVYVCVSESYHAECIEAQSAVVVGRSDLMHVKSWRNWLSTMSYAGS